MSPLGSSFKECNGTERQLTVINGRQAIAIIRVDGTRELSQLENFEKSRFIKVFVVVSRSAEVIEMASAAGKIAHQIQQEPHQELSDEDYVRAIVDSEEDDIFIEGDPYLVFINLGQCGSTIEQIDTGLLRLSSMPQDLTLVAQGVGVGRLSAFSIFGQFTGPNSEPL